MVMTSTGLVGLFSLFIVDFLNLFYIAKLDQPELKAAVGYCGAILFFLISIAIGFTIATTALTARAIGAGDRDRARRVAGSSIAMMTLVTGGLCLLLWPFLGQAVGLLGATGKTREVATGFLEIALTGMPVMSVGMGLSGVLRAVGDARRAMYVTLFGGLALAALDPLLIFGLHMGITGAAIATVLSRFVLLGVGWYGAVTVHKMVARPSVAILSADTAAIAAIALPAILTNVATPVGNAWATSIIARFGDSAVAGWTVVDRLVPLAFGGIFALSGSVGPILGQNFGAGRHDRVRGTITGSMLLTCIYILVCWAILRLSLDGIISTFALSGDGEAIVRVFCNYVGGSFIFMGALFVANAAFNNLGFAFLSTTFNWGRATLGTIPFAYLGAEMAGPVGAGIGVAIGTVIFGAAALIACYIVIDRQAKRAIAAAAKAG